MDVWRSVPVEEMAKTEAWQLLRGVTGTALEASVVGAE